MEAEQARDLAEAVAVVAVGVEDRLAAALIRQKVGERRSVGIALRSGHFAAEALGRDQRLLWRTSWSLQ
jgi:hypothetical protein